MSLVYLHHPLLLLHLATRFTSAFPAGFMFTRSAATVSLSFLSPLSASILSKPLAGAFNRQWHLSPRAVMSPIHQQGMTACVPPPSLPLTQSGGDGSRYTRPNQLESVCAEQTHTHGHWIRALNHWSLMCASRSSHLNPFGTSCASPEGEDGGHQRREDRQRTHRTVLVSNDSYSTLRRPLMQ